MRSFSVDVTLWDVAAFAMVFIGATAAVLSWFDRRRTNKAGRYVALALGVVILNTAGVLLTKVGLGVFVSHIPFNLSLALGPLLFFYVRSAADPRSVLRRTDLLHFIPAVVQVLSQLVLAKNTFLLLTNIHQKGLALHIVVWLNMIAAVSVSCYLYWCHLIIKDQQRQQKFNDGDRYRYQFRGLHRTLVIVGLIWSLWTLLTFSDSLAPGIVSIQWHYVSYLLTSFTILWMAFRQLLIGDEVAPTTLLALKPLLPPDLKQKAAWLKHELKDKRYYEDPELNLTSLAQHLGIHTHELSRLINMGLKKTFNDLINELRVKAAARKMQDPLYDHLTLLGIGLESGFNSQSTFNRIFKQFTGKSPLEYKNEWSTYKLGSSAQFADVVSSTGSTAVWSGNKQLRNFMFKSYFKIAGRSLMRNKSYAIINIAGLAVGISVCMVIFMVIRFHTGYDGFHSKKDRIYRVITEYHDPETGDVTFGKDVPFPLPLDLKTGFHELEEVAPVFASQDDQLLIPDANGKPEKLFKEEKGVFYTNPSFFKIFNFPLLAGTYASLKDPNNVFLSKETADRYFGDWRLAIGKTVKLQTGGFMFEHGTDVLRVSGVLATIPPTTDLQLKVVVSYGTGFTGDYLSSITDHDRTVTNFGCYVRLSSNASSTDFNRRLASYSQSVRSPGNKDSHLAQPLSDIHYDTQVSNYSNNAISHQLLNVLWLIASFILLIACVNFVNLSTAQVVKRAKEVGVRKVLGSDRSQLQVQFLTETFFIVVAAVVFAAIITAFALPATGRVLDLPLSFNIFTDPAVALFLLIITVMVTALAGSYPSMVMSRSDPITALKNKLTAATGRSLSLRRGLVVFQFMIAQALIIGTLIIVRQMDYFMDKPLGFDKDAIVNVPFRVDSVRISRLNYLKDQLMLINGVEAVSYSSNTPIENGNDTWTEVKYDNEIRERGFKAITKFADEGYLSAYKLKLIAGRNLQPSTMTKEFLVNEAFVKSLGLIKPEDILNKEISIWNGQIRCPVVGVLKDFNDRSFRHQVAPLTIATNNTMYNQAGIKLATSNMATTLGRVKAVFERTFPEFVYDQRFLDEKVAGFYKQEQQLSQLYKTFAAIAILLSCLGLYGLASFMAVQRTKEVGIRKILGASAASIVYLFSKEFVILISVAFVIAAPLAWYNMHQWLQAYVYRVNISWWIFAVGGASAVVTALIAISFQALKAAMADPAKSLRND